VLRFGYQSILTFEIYVIFVQMIKQFFQSEFIRNTLKLLTGTALSSAIGLLTLPIITRLYTAEDFGNYQLFYSIVIVLGGVACLKYELAIVLPKKDDDVNYLAFISLGTLGLFSMLTALVFYLFQDFILGFLNAEILADYVPLIGIGVFAVGLYQFGTNILLRNKRFNDISKNKILMTGGNQGGALLLGYFAPSFIWLVVSFVFGNLLAASIVFYRKLISFKDLDMDRVKELLVIHKKFPLLNTPNIFINTTSLQLPVFMISKYFSADILGLFNLASRISMIPMGLMGTSISQVYYQTASQAYNETGDLLGIYYRTLRKLAVLGLAPFLLMLIFAPYFVDLIFGEDWADTGEYMQIMSFYVYFQFLYSPLSRTFIILNRQEIGFYISIGAMAIRLLSMYMFRDSITEMLIALSVSASGIYIFYNLVTYHYILREKSKKLHTG